MGRRSVLPRGADWRTGEVGGIPWLAVRDLIVPTGFDRTGRAIIVLDGDWGLRLDPEGSLDRAGLGAVQWNKFTVPGVVNAAESPNVEHSGAAWFRRAFEAPETPLDTEPVIVFEGALLRGEVWLNGTALGCFEGGFSPVRMRASSLAAGLNELVVRLDNRLTPDSLPPRIMDGHRPGWHPYCGIHRPCRVEYVPRASVQKVVVTKRGDGGADLAVIVSRPSGTSPLRVAATLTQLRGGSGDVSGDGDLRLSVALEPGAEGPGPGGSILSSWTGTTSAQLAPWTPERPRVFDVEIAAWPREGRLESPSDSVSLTTGVRRFEVEGESLLLEGRPVFLKGICKHEDHPELGPAQTDELIEGDLGLAKGLGANWLRLAHYPHDRRELARARDLGLMVSEEIPLYQAGVGFTAWFQEKRPFGEFPLALFGMRQLGRRAFRDNARRQLIEMIERDRNNPALIFWGVGNESYTLGARAGKFFSELADLARRFDPSRPVSNVELTYHIPFLDSSKRGWKGMDILCLNSYFGWYYGSTSELGGFLDETRRRWPGRPVVLSEFGCDAAPGRSDSDGPWKAERVASGKTYSEDYQARTLTEYCRAALARPWIRGLAPWVLTDFYNTWFPGNPVPNYNLKGLCSSRRVPKKGYHALKEIYRDL